MEQFSDQKTNSWGIIYVWQKHVEGDVHCGIAHDVVEPGISRLLETARLGAGDQSVPG
jgi:hypothetical protein